MASKKWRVLIVDQLPIIRLGLSCLLEDSNFSLLIANSSLEGSIILREEKVDLLIIDFYREDRPGYAVIVDSLKSYPALNVILFTSIKESNLLYRLYEKGCSIISKSESPEAILKGIKATLIGKKFLSQELNYIKNIKENTHQSRPLQFTKQEERIVALISVGLSSDEIAHTIQLSKATVDTYRRRLLKKFQFNNIMELINYAKSIHSL
jgi:two-component system response regulator EvgA